jgi:hypothetical protein
MGMRAAFQLAFGRFPEGASRRRYSGSPTLSGLKQHWQELQDARKAYLDASP